MVGAILISFLYFPPQTMPFLANGIQESTQRAVVVETVKPLITEPSPKKYTATKEELIRFLEQQFALYGIKDQTEKAKKVITCESSWNIFAKNGI